MRYVVGIIASAGLMAFGLAATGLAGPLGTEKTPSPPALKLKGNAIRGKAVFRRADCAECHTLRAAHATGRSATNLDQAKPSFARVVRLVSLGSKPVGTYMSYSMPAFSKLKGAQPAKLVLTNQQIADVAKFVSTVAGH